MQTIYFGKNRKGQWKASLDMNKIIKLDNLQQCQVERVNNNKVYMVVAYFGFDYGINTIYDVIRYSQVYHSVSAAKKSELWQMALGKYKENPSGYVVDDFNIASDDGFGHPFTYGDAMEGKFNVQIIPVRVVG